MPDPVGTPTYCLLFASDGAQQSDGQYAYGWHVVQCTMLAAMRVLWTHNFDPAHDVAGSFMFTAAEAVRGAGLDVELQYLGDLRRPLGIVQARRVIQRRAEEFDLVHAQFGSACALATAAVKGLPLVISLRGSDWTPALSQRLRYQAHGWAATTMTRLALPSYSLAVCVSERIRNEVRVRKPALKSIVLPDPIDTQKFHPSSKEEARRRLGLSTGDVKYVLFTSVHRESENKRLWLAEQAVALAQARDSRIQILVATGYAPDDMPSVVAAADVSICTSNAEGWPNCIKESLACGVPFVATDVSDLAGIAAAEPSCHVAAPNAEALGEAILASLAWGGTPDFSSRLDGMSFDAFSTGLISSYESILAEK